MDGESCSWEAVEEVVRLFGSGLGHFALGALLLIGIMCVAQGVLPGWQFSCIPGSFSSLKASSRSFAAQCFYT